MTRGNAPLNKLVMRITPAGATLTVNGTVAVAKSGGQLNGGQIRFATSIFSASVPNFRGRIYQIEIKTI